MYKQITKKNVKLQLDRINNQLWTKGDILAFGKMLNSYRFSSPERKSQVMELWSKLEDRTYDKTYDITKEQSDFGIEWLNKLCFTKSGKNRETKMVDDFRESDFNIVRNFSTFQFVGFHETYGGYNYYYSPIYRTIDKQGNYFDYTMSGGHWGKPEIVGRGKIQNKLEKALA